MSSSIVALKELFDRDLKRLSNEIEAYKLESDLWIVEKAINNSAGNLCLHICGNLQHFFGREMGGTDYVRQREAEFNLKNVPREELLALIEKSKNVVSNTLNNFDENLLDQPFPVEILGYPMTYAYFMIHLVGHLNYHLGQINYHRRILS